MSKAQLKPTFITLGHIRVRRKHFSGLIKQKDGGIGVLIGAESPYTEYVNNPERAERVLEDYQRLKENKML